MGLAGSRVKSCCAQAMANRPSPALSLTQPKWGDPDWLDIHILREMFWAGVDVDHKRAWQCQYQSLIWRSRPRCFCHDLLLPSWLLTLDRHLSRLWWPDFKVVFPALSTKAFNLCKFLPAFEVVLLNLQCIKAPTGISPAWTYVDTPNWIYKCPTLLVHLNLRMWGKLHLPLLLGTLVNIAFSCLFQIPIRYHDILCESIRYVHTIIRWYKISRSDNITKYQDKIPFTSSFTANWHQQILIIYVGIHHRDNLSNQNPNPKTLRWAHPWSQFNAGCRGREIHFAVPKQTWDTQTNLGWSFRKSA